MVRLQGRGLYEGSKQDHDFLMIGTICSLIAFFVQIHFTVKMGSLQQSAHLETKQHVDPLLFYYWFMLIRADSCPIKFEYQCCSIVQKDSSKYPTEGFPTEEGRSQVAARSDLCGIYPG